MVKAPIRSTVSKVDPKESLFKLFNIPVNGGVFVQVSI
jgi:hypothetical protein